jgi:proline dehydrogenase
MRNKSPFSRLLFTILMVAGVGLLLYKNGERWLRAILLYLSGAAWARQLVSDLPVAQQVAGRFVAGQTAVEAMNTAQELNARGLTVTLDYLGESVADKGMALAARDEILHLLDQIAQTSVNANVSLKLSQLGLNISEALAADNMRQILARARHHENRVRIDMEDSPVVDKTLALYRRLRDKDGFNNVGVVIQAYLYRSDEDIRQLVAEGAWVRLCKGAYAEPPEVAYPQKADTDASFIRLMQRLLSAEARENGVYAAIATHDERMIQATLDYVHENGISPEEFEFQMLYGIRRELQDDLRANGYRVRVYVPYGQAWYPYFMRRLAERPANLYFFLSNLIRQ